MGEREAKLLENLHELQYCANLSRNIENLASPSVQEILHIGAHFHLQIGVRKIQCRLLGIAGLQFSQ